MHSQQVDPSTNQHPSRAGAGVTHSTCRRKKVRLISLPRPSRSLFILHLGGFFLSLRGIPSIMFLRSILLGGSALASAMLVDPVTESADGFEIINPTQLDEYTHATFALPCAECPFRETNEEGQVDYTQGSPSSLVRLTSSQCTLMANQQ